LAIFSLSAPGNFEERDKLRREVEKFRRESARKIVGSVHLTFLVGRTERADVMRRIEAESEMFGDILQLGVPDSYPTLSLKTLGAYAWLASVS
jgi:hypothetical protein